MYRSVRSSAVALLSSAVLMASGAVALAAAPTKAAVLSDWTQTSATSYATWNAARQNQSAWADYAFDWSTDYCSSSPDKPAGFDFKLSCYRHDFGYRNYKAAGQFDAAKARLDSAFYADLGRKCDTYDPIVQPACDALAWVYYQAVKVLGVTTVSPADLDRAARMKAAALRRAG
jgi:phospholipase A2-like protein